MRHLVLAFVLALVGCLGDEGDSDDCVLGTCPSVCGNDRVEGGEECDGTAPSCESLGYFGGTSQCTACRLDKSYCDACVPGVTCSRLVNHSVWGLASSGTFLGVLGIVGGLTILDGSSEVARVGLDAHTVVGVPGGWILGTAGDPAATLTSLDLRGSVVATHSVPIRFAPTMASGPADRVVLVGQSYDPPSAWAAIASSNGDIVVPGTPIFPAERTPVWATTDGTSFFVAADNTVARITPDGAVTINSGFPLVSWVRVTSDIDGGWYVGKNIDVRNVAQRFDASGAPVGAPLEFEPDDLVAVLAVDSDLLLLSRKPLEPPGPFGQRAMLRLRRVAPDGSMSSPRDIGITRGSVYMIRHGQDVAIGWSNDNSSYVATVTP